MKISVKVVPNAKGSRIEKVADGSLKVFLKSPARENKANIELAKLLSSYLDVPKSRINLKLGKTSKNKIIEIIE